MGIAATRTDRPRRRLPLATAACAVLAAGCSALLPGSETVTDSPWQSYEEAQAAFAAIVPYMTTVEDLKPLRLDPAANPNVTVLNYSDVLRRFLPSPAADPAALDAGVQECLRATVQCIGYEVDHRLLKRRRYGNFWADMLNFSRKTEIVGWRFNAVLLVVDGIVVYKLTGGQPAIHEHEQSRNPLGPLQGAGESLLR